MKKLTISLFLILVIILSAIFLASCKPEEEYFPTPAEIAAAEQTEFEFAFATDVHVMEEETEINDYQHPAFIAKEIDTQKMNFISEAIFETFCNDVIASGVKYVLIAGDLTERGTVISHQKVASELARLKENGVQAYVVPGNHDLGVLGGKAYRYTSEGAIEIPKITNEQFAEIYEDFGYGENSTRYQGSLTYTLDMNPKYTLIGVDNVTSKIDQDLVNWIETQVESAFFAGKTPILMMHKPLGERFTGLYDTFGINVTASIATSKSVLVNMKKQLAEAGLTYILTGHVHSNDIMQVKSGHMIGEQEKMFIDIMGNCTSFYDSTYRQIRFTANYVDISLKHIVPKEANLPAYLTAEDKEQILTNWENFSLAFGKIDFVGNFSDKLDLVPIYLAQFVLGVDLANPEIDPQIITDVTEYAQKHILDYMLEMPLYEKDKGVEDTFSVEGLAIKYGFSSTFPSTDYKTVFDVATTIVFRAICAGEAEYVQGAPELELIKYGLYGLIANLKENNFFEFVKGYIPEIDITADTEEAIRNLYSEGILSLLDSNILDNILSLPVISQLELPGALSYLDLSNVSGSKLLMAMYTLMPAINELIGTELSSLFPVDLAEEAFTGDLDFESLVENFFFVKLGSGALYDTFTKTQDLIIARADFTVYPK